MRESGTGYWKCLSLWVLFLLRIKGESEYVVHEKESKIGID